MPVPSDPSDSSVPSDPTDPVSNRKDDHLDICLHREVESGARSGLDAYTLEYDALPEVDLHEVDLTCRLLGTELRAPLIIASMTGGTKRAGHFNRLLARAAARLGIAMGLGSQRAMIRDPSLTGSFNVRDAAPDLPLLLGNIGAVQLNRGLEPERIGPALDAVGADAVYLHLNPLQEAIQPQGDTCFRGLRARMEQTIATLELPVLVKEVGAGISERTAGKLASLPIRGIEVAGVGGTSWARVESYRNPERSPAAVVGRRLAGFGVPTVDAIRHCRAALGPNRPVIASGGIRTGLDVALAMALGADAAAIGRPLLAAAKTGGEAGVVAWLEQLIHGLRVVCFVTGAPNLAALRRVRVLPVKAGP